MKVNNGDNITTLTIPSNCTFLLLTYEDKAIFAPQGICVEPMIIPLDRADNRNFVMNMYAGDNFFTWGRFEYSVKDNILYFRDCACYFNGNTSTKPWVDSPGNSFVTWFSDKVSEGVAFFVISVKV